LYNFALSLSILAVLLQEKPYLLFFSRVTFPEYYPGSAFIIIRAKDKPLRCSRDDLFTIKPIQASCKRPTRAERLQDACPVRS
jgi:hypothetical protein